MELLRLSATALARGIRERDVSAREVVERHLDRILEVNPTLNAVVALRAEAARREADAADARVRTEPAGALPPLLGVPCTIKEAFAVTGMPQSSGLVARSALRAQTDATAVRRLRAAGAIVLGVTNVSELCMWMESNNRVYGRTNNPYDRDRIVGGSSGGEGAIVAAGGAPFGLGSDIGGSIRMPAFFNGVFGHKPTGGLVPGTGQYPIAQGVGLRYLTTGPLARRAEDLYPLLQVLAGPDGEDSGCVPLALPDPRTVALRDLDVVDVPWDGRVQVSAELRGAQERARDHLASLGCRVRTREVPSLRRAPAIWSAMLTAASGTTFAELLGTHTAHETLWELARWATRRSEHTLPALLLALIEELPRRRHAHTRRLIEEGLGLREELDALLGPRGVLLYPSYPTCAPRHYAPMLPPFRWTYTAIWNVLEMPVTQVPLGLGAEGLPLGVQVAARRGRDDLTLAVALELERAFGGWVFPSSRERPARERLRSRRRRPPAPAAP